MEDLENPDPGRGLPEESATAGQAENPGDQTGLSGRGKAPELPEIRVVATAEDLRMVYAVRAAVFLGKSGWTYHQAFDENDFSATHLLALVGGEPAGALRLRWFAGFARIERLAIRPEFRSLRLLNSLARSALRLCRKKGYDKVGGLTRPDLLPFWARHGAKPCGETLDSRHGPVVPIIGTPSNWNDIVPFTPQDAGKAGFEWDIYGWEADGV